jgi:CheY-like chemotaxis protein
MRFRAAQEKNYVDRRIALNLIPQLLMGSDRLTNSARAYATTGDQRYRNEFENELTVDRTRETAVDQLMQIGPSQYELGLLTRAKGASDQLVKIERRTSELVAANDRAGAVALVYGDEFRSLKNTVVQSINDSRQSLDNRLTAQAIDLAGRAKVADIVGLVATAVNAIAIVGALVLFYRRRVVNPLTMLDRNLRDLEQWGSQAFDMILMDVQMPEMDGLEATRAIRKAEGERGGHVPIIAMTANAMAGDREICLSAGMDGYVTKPVKRESLFSKMGRVRAPGGAHAGA